MPLGIEPNSIAPSLIQNSGAALVQGIRQIGQQISGHLTEIQTKRDLGALAQEMQGINVQSNDFPVQLTQLLSRHPLAARDERGQIALSILGKAHGQWQQQQIVQQRADAQLPLIAARNEASLGQIAARTSAAQETEQMRQVGRSELEEIKQSNRLETQEARTQGQLQTLEARQNAPMTPYQRDALALRKNAERRAAIKEQVDSVERDIRALEQSLRSESKMNVLPGEKVEWQKQVEKLRDQRNQLLEQFNAPPTAEEITIEPELGAVPAGAATPQGDVGAVLPAPGAVAAPLPDGNELVPVINPQGKPTRIKKSQLESALQNGYRTR